MDKRWKYLLAALLGFSTACSTVRRTPAGESGETPGREAADSSASRADTDSLTPQQGVQMNRIRLMYGGPSPRPEVAQPAENEAPEGAATAE